ncbi:uncharacterized protein LOC143560704 [Bidens hawaiensis]|uniref:uncharacterized protein LOC143560704 n=1 Tax=Bidens hawaiensis TaxID=980011 RepID=UPI00404B8ED6
MASPKMSLKLLVDRKGSRVLFAEATKEFVDFLFHIFSLPLGTLSSSLDSKQMVGCLGNLKKSIESFHGDYLQPDIKIDDIFNPKTTFNGNTFVLSYDADASSEDQSKAVYRCENGTRSSYYSESTHRVKVHPFRSPIRRNIECSNACPECGGSMNVPMTVVIPNEVLETRKEDKEFKGGYVKEVVTYMVMDDLVVKPMSTISSITLLNKFGVKDPSQLGEKMVTLGKDEALKLLAASFEDG